MGIYSLGSYHTMIYDKGAGPKYWTRLIGIDNLQFLVMAAKPRHNWAQEDLVTALNAIKEDKLSLREAAAKYGIPKSTIYTYTSGKSVIGKRPGPSTILTPTEEKKLVEYALHMSEIGYGRTKVNGKDNYNI